jgi:hypothetical protein
MKKLDFFVIIVENGMIMMNISNRVSVKPTVPLIEPREIV